MDISVVVPVYNEEANLSALYGRLVEELDALKLDWEVVFTDDGSTDGSVATLEELARKDDRIKVVVFRRNFGQTAAMEAGFRAALGDVVVPMDADLQNDPADIGKLLRVLEEGYDVAKGWRRDRKDTYINRTLPSRIANFLISRVTGVRLHDYGCTLTAYRREIIREIRLYGEMHRFIPAYAVWAGGRIREVEVAHHPRTQGQTKYGISRTFRVLLDLMTVRFLVAYSTKPNYLFGKWGLLAMAASILSFIWAVTKKLIWGDAFYTDPFFYAGIFMGMAGLQILLIGLLAELNMRTYFESQDRTPYVIRKTCNIPDGDPKEERGS